MLQKMKLISQRLKSTGDCELKPKTFEMFTGQHGKQPNRRRQSEVPYLRNEESGVSGSGCACPLCKITPVAPSPVPETIIKVWEGSEEQSFTWFVQQLAELSEVTDFSLLIPETVVFKRSKPAFMLQINKDGYLKGSFTPEKIKKEDIIRNFTNIVRARKRDDVIATPFAKAPKTVNKSASVGEASTYGKEIALIRYYSKGHDNETPIQHPQDEQGPVRIALESEFFEMMFERGGSSLWKSLVYIQTVLKSKVGLNEVIMASYDSSEPFEKSDASLNILKKTNPELYCAVVMRKINKAFKNYVHYEILGMECEFMKDDNGDIWLYYVRRLFVKRLPEVKKIQPIEETFQEKQERQKKVIEHIEAVGRCSPANTNTSRLMGIMQDEFEEVKAKTRIEEVLRPRPKDILSISAYERLRPRAKYSFEQMVALEPKSVLLPQSRLSSASRPTRPVALSEKVRPSTSSTKTASTAAPRGWHYTPRVKLRSFRQSRKSIGSI